VKLKNVVYATGRKQVLTIYLKVTGNRDQKFPDDSSEGGYPLSLRRLQLVKNKWCIDQIIMSCTLALLSIHHNWQGNFIQNLSSLCRLCHQCLQ